MKSTGYSGTSLAKKLGLKEGFKAQIINQPDYYLDLFDDLPERVDFATDNDQKKNLIHYFVTQVDDLFRDIRSLKAGIEQDGMIWVSWPKKASKMQTDITEDSIRDLALKNGLVDVKVCAVDADWSGLKLVIPVKDRLAKP